MAKRSAFVLPAGLDIDLSGDTMSLSYDGDIVIENTLGKALGDIEATGDLTVRLPVINGNLRAGRKLVLRGRIEAKRLHGLEVHIGDEDVKARAISADGRIVIGAANLKVDAIIAPEIQMDPRASGRVTVIESKNERGATKIKGGFSVNEYDEIIGDAAEFLAERGLTPLGDGPAPAALEEDEEDEEPELELDPEPPPSAPTPPAPEPAADDGPEPLGHDEEEDVDDPESLNIEDLEPITDDLHPRLAEALKRITTCYEGTEVPPAVTELEALVTARDYTKLRASITDVWNGLLGFHQKRGIRPHHQVTHAFNIIHGLVQEV
jgi:hypothetical protein